MTENILTVDENFFLQFLDALRIHRGVVFRCVSEVSLCEFTNPLVELDVCYIKFKMHKM